MSDLPRFMILPAERLPDTEQVRYRFAVGSSSSDRTYIIGQNIKHLFWSCSCPGWTRRKERYCRHLRALRLPGGEEPYDVEVVETFEQTRLGITTEPAIEPRRLSPQSIAPPKPPPPPEPEPLPELEPGKRRFKFGQGV